MGRAPTTTEFNEERWTLLKVRWVSFVAAVAYPIWCPIYHVVVDQPYDPLWQRLMFALLPLAAFLASFPRRISSAQLEFIYNLFVYALTAHVFFLVYKNDVSTPYVLGAYCMMFCGGLGPLNERTQWRIILFTLTLIAILCYLKPQENTYFLASGGLTSGGIAYASQRAILYLIDQLRSSRMQIQDKNVVLDNMLNSLGQGFLSFDREGRCLPVYSRACELLLETRPAGQAIWDVLKEPPEISELLGKRVRFAFDSDDGVADFVALMPTVFPNSQSRHVVLSYHPARAAGGKVTEIVVVATDQTELQAAQNAADKERHQALMIGSIIRQKSLFHLFLTELRTGLAIRNGDLSYEQAGDDFKRFLHSIKGGARIFLMEEFATFVHRLEEQWVGKAFAARSDCAQFIRDQVTALENELNTFLTEHPELRSEFGNERMISIPVSEVESVITAPEFHRSLPALCSQVQNWTLLPIGTYFEPYFSLCGRLAQLHTKKLAPVEVHGADLMIYPEFYADLISSSVHLFSNFIEHGLESPMERNVLGKPEAGLLRVTFSRRVGEKRDNLLIEVRDDGRGIDPSTVREKMRRQGHVQQADLLSDQEVMNWIFAPGFSTREIVTETAGRGVGLSALKHSVQALGGSVRVSSRVGQGTVFTIEVPELTPHAGLRRDPKGRAA